MDLLSFSTDLEAQADQLVSVIFVLPTNYSNNRISFIIQIPKS